MKEHLEKAVAYRKTITAQAEREASSSLMLEKKRATGLLAKAQDPLGSVDVEGPLVLKEVKKDKSIFQQQLGLETTYKVESFEFIGWSDPTASTANKALKWLNSLKFEN